MTDTIKLAEQTLGSDGSKMMSGAAGQLPPSDMAMLADPAFIAGFAVSMRAMFAQGVQGYVDDRLADGPGWGSFDVGKVCCPVTVLHGGSDTIVPGSVLDIRKPLGHFSIISEVIPAILTLRGD